MKRTYWVIAGYGFFTLIMMILGFLNNFEEMYFYYLPSLPWSLLAVSIEEVGILLVFGGFTIIYIVNGLLLVYLSREKRSLSKQVSNASRHREVFYISLIHTLFMLLWGGCLIYYGMICTGKYCGFAASSAYSPMIFIFDQLGDPSFLNLLPGETGNIFAFISNLIFCFFMMFIGCSIIFKDRRKTV